MGDLIDRQQAIAEAEWAMIDSISITRDDWRAIVEALKELPSAKPEIVRCKDCMSYLPPHGCVNLDGMAMAQEDGFCSYAERREDE